MSKAKEVLLNPIFNDNPIALQILGICSALGCYRKSIYNFNYVCGLNDSGYVV